MRNIKVNKSGAIYTYTEKGGVSVEQWLATHFPNTPSGDVTIVTLTRDQEPEVIAMREKRDALLAQCDWTQITDSPLNASKKAQWATYRQALRDFPTNWTPSKPWPTQPT